MLDFPLTTSLDTVPGLQVEPDSHRCTAQAVHGSGRLFGFRELDELPRPS